jgi:hypothetical protein
MMRQFLNNLKEVGMVLGQLFIPLLQKVMPVINGVTIAIKRLLVSIASLLGIKLDLQGFGQGYTSLSEDVDGVTDSLDDATKSAKKFKTVTLGIDELNINAPQDNTSGGVNAGLSDTIDLTQEILKATEEYEAAWQKAFDNMQNKAQDFADKVTNAFKPITEPFANLDWATITQNISNFSNAIAPYAEEFGKGFIEFFDEIIPMVLCPKVIEDNMEALNLIKEEASKTANITAYISAIDVCLNQDVEDKLKDITIPTLIFAGKYDEISPLKIQEDLNNKLNNSEIIIFDNVKHNILIGENIDKISNIVKEFI